MKQTGTPPALRPSATNLEKHGSSFSCDLRRWWLCGPALTPYPDLLWRRAMGSHTLVTHTPVTTCTLHCPGPGSPSGNCGPQPGLLLDTPADAWRSPPRGGKGGVCRKKLVIMRNPVAAHTRCAECCQGDFLDCLGLQGLFWGVEGRYLQRCCESLSRCLNGCSAPGGGGGPGTGILWLRNVR